MFKSGCIGNSGSASVIRGLHPAVSALLLLTGLLCNACGSSGDDEPDPIVTHAPGQVSALEAFATSTSSVRLFWSAAQDDGVVTGYDVYRDGVLLVSETPDVHYTDLNAALSTEVATSYLYEVMAVDDEGNRGEVASIVLSLPAVGPVIDTDNYADIVGLIMNVVSGNAYKDDILSSTVFGLDHEPTSVDVNVDIPGVFDGTRYYDCSNAGTITMEVIEGVGGTETHSSYDDCAWQERIWNGRSSYYLASGSGRYVLQGLTIADTDDLLARFDGSFPFTAYMCSGEGDWQWKASSERIVVPARSGDLLLTDVETDLSYGNDCGIAEYAAFMAEFAIRAPVTLGRTINVSTPVGFVNSGDRSRYFPIGQLLLDAGDGNSLLLDADNDDPSSLHLTLTLDGNSYEFDESWDRWVNQLVLD